MNDIVVIDDSKAVCFYTKKAFEDAGYTVHTFEHPLEAIKTIPEINPLLVLCDYIMFDMTGFDVIQSLRMHGVNCKYALFTAFEDEKIKTLCEQNNIIFLKKTLDMENITEIIINHVWN